MKIKIFFAVLLFVFVFCSVSPVLAMTDAEKQALIVQLQAQIVQLQIQIAEIIAQQNGGVWCHTFNNNLGWANTGSSEIYNLHLALQKEGISYSPDDTNVYNIGTSNALIQFQAKYGILQTGYLGNLTRAKLNALYGCVAKECVPSWDCADWSMCVGGQQTRTCSDKNNCGVDTKRPNLSQTCTQKPAVKMQADGSDGPLNIFLTLGNGATVTTTGINLAKSIILQWDSIDVSSCTASDSLTPAAFSGFKPSSGSLAVNLSGTIEGMVNSTSKVTDTFKMTCVSTETGKSVADSVTVNLFYNVNANCNPNWDCSDWSSCSNKKHTRTCTDWNGCGSLVNKPLETEACLPAPAVDIKGNNSDGPIAIPIGGSIALSWTSTNATSCTASGGWSGTKDTHGSTSIYDLTSYKTFTITCTGSGGSATDSVVANIPSPQ